MRIKNIHIYGFGKWVDQKWDLTEGQLDLFFGNNESGKSTLMAFIHAVFFGFPSKRENQFVPRDADRYGGAISIEYGQNETVFIERVAGKTQRGKVTVQYSDGRSGDEKDLQSLLKGMDLATFKGVFHFDLEGLQGMKDLTPKELSRYLYDAGMMGANKLSALEKNIEQESERLFKPRGKTTTINEMANQLTDMKLSLSKWEERLDEYETIQANVREKEERLKLISEEQVFLQQKSRKLDKQISLSPLVRDWFALKQQEEKEQKIKQFPLDGIHRFDHLRERLTEKEARILHEKDQIEDLSDKRKNLSEGLSTNKKIAITEVIEEFPLYKKTKEEERQLQFDEGEQIKLQNILEEDWAPIDHQVFLNAQTNGYIFEKYDQLKSKWQFLYTKDERLHEEKNKLDKEQKVTLDQFENERKYLLSDTEESELEKKLFQRENQAILNQQKTLLTDQLDWLKRGKERDKSSEKMTVISLFLISFLFLTVAVIRLFLNDVISFSILLIVSLAMMFLIRKTKQVRKREIKKFEAEISKVSSKLENIKSHETAGSDDEQLKKLLKQHQEKKVQVDGIKQKNNYVQRQLDQWKKDSDELKKEWTIFDRQLMEWCVEGSFPKGKEVLFYDRFLPSLKEWKQLNKYLNTLSEKRKQLLKIMSKYEERILHLTSADHTEDTVSEKSIEEKVTQLRQILLYSKEQEEQKQRIKDKIGTHSNLLLQVEEEHAQLTMQLEELLTYAGVYEEEAFREKAKKSLEQKENKNKLQEWYLQIASSIPDEFQRKQLIDDIIYEKVDASIEQEQLDQQVTEKEQEKTNLLKESSQLKLELHQLEVEGTYEEQLQKFTSFKEKLNVQARDWATYKLSQYMIKKVKAIYEKQRQPKVMKQAQFIFARLTANNYVYLFAPLGEERFLVERKDGQRFSPGDLSRGTCELLYLSIRLALAIEDSNKNDFPLFLDETFVNFDKSRRVSVINYLKELSIERQILLFTCHEHIKEEIKSAGTCDMVVHSLTRS